MSSQHELMSAVQSMQANAQANLPVIPNNGNPNGAYNMPRTPSTRTVPTQKPAQFSWLEPSPAMQQLQETMQQRQQYLNAMLGQIRQQPMIPQQPLAQQPQLPQQHPQLPTHIPMPANVVLPSTGMNTGIVPPNMQQQGVVLPQVRGM